MINTSPPSPLPFLSHRHKCSGPTLLKHRFVSRTTCGANIKGLLLGGREADCSMRGVLLEWPEDWYIYEAKASAAGGWKRKKK